MKGKHLLSLKDLDLGEITEILDLAAQLKRERGQSQAMRPLVGKSLALIFAKSSTRTRVSFEVGIHELGGHSLFLDKNDLQLGRGESMADTARVLSRYVHGIIVRYHDHEALVELASYASVPVINALTDKYHPCQVLADLQTIKERAGKLTGVKMAYLGDADNNMAHSLILGCVKTGMELHIGAPAAYQPSPDFMARIAGPGQVIIHEDPAAAVAGVDFLYTDVWVSMGFEGESAERLRLLQPYQVNDRLLQLAAPGAKVLHCLPAYRGKEITNEVLEGAASIVWDQAENRLHAQKAVLAKLVG